LEVWGIEPHAVSGVEPDGAPSHLKAKRCYAWKYQEDGKIKFTAVLELPPVESAETAVKVAIASKPRK
jgi:hypothetical protein